MNNLYLIYGTDYGLIKKEIDKISSNNIDVVKYDLSVEKVDLLLDEASCMSLFGEKKVIIGENSTFLTNSPTQVDHDYDYLLKYLASENKENIVIFTVLADKLDERKKIVKELKKNAKVIFKEKINDKDLSNFVIKEFKNNDLKIDKNTADYFVSYVGKNVDILLSEIEKMKIYEPLDGTVKISDINDISSKTLNDNIFDFTDAIMKKNFKKVFECYNDLIVLNEEPIKILSMLSNQFIFLYQAKLLAEEGKINSDIANVLNVHPYRVKLALETDYMIYELEKIIKDLHNLDYKIKSGKLDKKLALESFLLHL